VSDIVDLDAYRKRRAVTEALRSARETGRSIAAALFEVELRWAEQAQRMEAALRALAGAE
jgi:hypothetical protein